MLNPKRKYSNDELDRYNKSEQTRYWDQRTLYRSRVISRTFLVLVVIASATFVAVVCQYVH